MTKFGKTFIHLSLLRNANPCGESIRPKVLKTQNIQRVQMKLDGRAKCKVSRRANYPFKTNVKPVVLTCGKEKYMFLPDMLFIFNGNKVGVLSHDDINMKVAYAKCIEAEGVPKDAEIVDRTWEYINKDGGQDKRFKDNKEYPICSYGYLELTASRGLNTIIMFSKSSIIANFETDKGELKQNITLKNEE